MASTATTYGSGRERLLEAAAHIFARRGYRGATTREIAEMAGVTEPMIFRHFGSKLVLFELAAVEPVVGFMDDYVSAWGAGEPATRDAADHARDFFARLLEVLSGNRELLVAILAIGEFDPALEPAAIRVREAFDRVIGMFERMVDIEFTARQLDSPDRRALSRLMLGMIASTALLGDWLGVGESDTQVTRERMLDEAARVIVHGVGGPGAT